MTDDLETAIKQRARELGFALCGIAPAQPSAFKQEYRDWLERGFHGEMAYLARDPDRRLDPRLVLPDARSIVVVGMNYYTESAPDADDPERALFARYARNDDYHHVMGDRLRELLAFIRQACPCVPYEKVESATRSPDDSTTSESDSRCRRIPTEGRVYVDTGPILEREVAQRAGLGWSGKNTMLINTRKGSYFLLGEILLNLPLRADSAAVGGCGTCTRCLDACPTGAIVRPYEIDARRCISYLTIEQKGPIPEDLAARMGNRVFGCDICQEVCPFCQRRATGSTEERFQPREATTNLKVTDLLYMTDEEFRVAFKNSPVKRAKRRGLLRNAAAALSSRDDPEAIAALEHALSDTDPLVREQASRSLTASGQRR